LEPKNPISGIILSGGKSTRMGQNKAFTQIGGIPIISRIYDLFKQLFEEVIIVTNQGDFFRNFESRICQDLIPDKGALGGLYTGVFYATFHHSFCVACDMPFIQKPLVQYLAKNMQDYDVVVPRTHDGLQPLHAVYSKDCLAPIRRTIDEGTYKITDFYESVRVRIIEESEFLSLDPFRRSFININTPEELLSLGRENAFRLR
jgi:molybdopterin-guanine dinucleotide biosynthesis protein A